MMNLLSFNICGLGRGPKRAAFKCLLDFVCSSLVFLHETMLGGSNACSFFLRLRPGWLVSASDSCGNSGEILVA